MRKVFDQQLELGFVQQTHTTSYQLLEASYRKHSSEERFAEIEVSTDVPQPRRMRHTETGDDEDHCAKTGRLPSDQTPWIKIDGDGLSSEEMGSPCISADGLSPNEDPLPRFHETQSQSGESHLQQFLRMQEDHLPGRLLARK